MGSRSGRGPVGLGFPWNQTSRRPGDDHGGAAGRPDGVARFWRDGVTEIREQVERISLMPLAYRIAAITVIPPARRATSTFIRGVAMSQNKEIIERTAKLKGLYPTVIAPTGCRTCGIAGWDKALQSR
jgi:hypothetical protein